MKVSNVILVLGDGPNDIALHDLHVIDVVEQFESRRTDSLHEPDTPLRYGRTCNPCDSPCYSSSSIQTLTPFFSARPTTCLTPITQFSSPSSSDIP